MTNTKSLDEEVKYSYLPSLSIGERKITKTFNIFTPQFQLLQLFALKKEDLVDFIWCVLNMSRVLIAYRANRGAVTSEGEVGPACHLAVS